MTATISASGSALVTVTTKMTNNSNSRYMYMGLSVDSSAATDDRAVILFSGNANPVPVQASATFYVSGLSAGSHTFSARYYKTSGGTATFDNRQIAVIPLA